jgi:hypothetical protein
MLLAPQPAATEYPGLFGPFEATFSGPAVNQAPIFGLSAQEGRRKPETRLRRARLLAAAGSRSEGMSLSPAVCTSALCFCTARDYSTGNEKAKDVIDQRPVTIPRVLVATSCSLTKFRPLTGPCSDIP